MRRPALIQFIVAALLMLAALGAYGVELLMLSATRTKASTAFAEVARIEEEGRAVANAKDTIAALENDEASVASHFISPEGIVPFLEEVERSGKELGTTIEVVSVSSINASDGRITLALRIQGGFGAVMRTLGSLEYGPQDIRTTSLTLDTVSGEDSALWTAAGTFSVATLSKTP